MSAPGVRGSCTHRGPVMGPPRVSWARSSSPLPRRDISPGEPAAHQFSLVVEGSADLASGHRGRLFSLVATEDCAGLASGHRGRLFCLTAAAGSAGVVSWSREFQG